MATFDTREENNRIVVTIHMVELLRSVRDSFPNRRVGPPPPPGVRDDRPTARSLWDGVCDQVGDRLNEFDVSADVTLPGIPIPQPPPLVGGGDPQPPQPPAPPDPLQALQKIAEAINQAETKLNEQNLIIAGGAVEADLDVNVGGVVVAHSKIVFNITPNPYGPGPDE